MIKKIIHCADLHIRPYLRLDEYAEQFEVFVEKCREIAEPYEKDEVRILISGDICHSKINVSNELFTVASYLIRRLEEIAPVIVIAGNHDMIAENSTRTDTLTGLFNTAGFTNSKYLDMMLDYQSGCVVDDNVVWALYSIMDDFRRPDIGAVEKDGDTRVIGLYHGMVVGATLNNGSVVADGLDSDAFEGCDCVMAGHVHKKQELKRGDAIILYPGSLIQQTFGETVSQHGFAVWDVKDMTYEYVELPTEYGLYDIEIESIEDIDNDKERLVNF
jgi:DNA repair exonuclease SbcCD nuclease subunit